jgi:hypothetical protein
MTQAEEYERRAKEADRLAEQARHADVKRGWEEIAAHWRAMAKQAEQNGW